MLTRSQEFVATPWYQRREHADKSRTRCDSSKECNWERDFKFDAGMLTAQDKGEKNRTESITPEMKAEGDNCFQFFIPIPAGRKNDLST
jgi:hypothetical protein